MHKFNSKLVLTAVLAAALAAACGGSNGGEGGGVATDDIGQSSTRTLAFILALIGNDENSDPIDINPLTLAVDDAADPMEL